MSFPDDYQRNQQAGGPSAQLADLLGLPRQILIDTTTWTIILMDGTTEGGHRVVMLKDLADTLQEGAYLPQGDSTLVSTDADPTAASIQRAWSGAELRELFNLLATTATPGTWKLKNIAMPDQLKEAAPVITDANLALVSGWYRFNPATTLNLPGDIVATNSDRCAMLVIGKDSNNLTQIIFSMEDDGKMWKRVVIAGAFQAWQGTAGVTQASVDAKVAKAGDTMTGRLNLLTSTAGSASLRLASGAAPTTPIDGDIWRRDADGGLRFRKGGSTVSILDSTTLFRTAAAIIADQKATNVAPDPQTPGVWTKRSQNTELSDIDGIVTLSSGEFTLLAGGVYKAQAFASVNSFSGHASRIRFYNVTDAVDIVSNLNGLRNYDGSNSHYNFQMAQAILTGGKTYRLEMWTIQAAQANGIQLNIAGTPEIYSMVTLERLTHVI